MKITITVSLLFFLEWAVHRNEIFAVCSVIGLSIVLVTFFTRMSRATNTLKQLLGATPISRSFGSDPLEELETLTTLCLVRQKQLVIERDIRSSPIPRLKCVDNAMGGVVPSFLENIKDFLINTIRADQVLIEVKHPRLGRFESFTERALRDAIISHRSPQEISLFRDSHLERWGILYDIGLNLPGERDWSGMVWVGFRDRHMNAELVHKPLLEIGRHISDELSRFAALQEQDRGKNSLESQHQFVRHASHDIRSPLNNIRSITQFLLIDICNSEHRELLETVIKNCQAMGEIVETMLDYSSLSTGIMRIMPTESDISTIVKEVTQSFEISARLKGLRLISHVSTGISGAVDPRVIRRVLSNLISNAIKYTHHGTVTVSLLTEGNSVVFLVSDTGIGLDADQLQSLYIPFNRFNRDQDGVGLGLVVTKQLITACGGNIFVSSQVGEGTQFKVTIPLASVVTDKDKILGDKTIKYNGIPTILLVDDDIECASSLSRLLAVHGIPSFIASGYNEAVGILALESIDLVITDYEMPHQGGKRLLSLLEAKYPSIRCIVVTGGGQSAVDATRYPIITKPADLKELLMLIQAPQQKKAA